MMRISEPQYSFEETLEKCISGITGNDDLQKKLTDSKPALLAEEIKYLEKVRIGMLSDIKPINTVVNSDPVVINALKKSDMIKIYDQYFVAEKKPARKIYDALLNAAKEGCPFCGGIGTPRNLDHFLPKAHFPQFSVQPRNLVPACRDCNMDGKAHAFAKNEENQIIHPYADKNRFFSEQWIFAIYHAGINGEPGDFEYFVNPPENWPDVDKKRVRKHFKDFNLARRYAIKAAEPLGMALKQRESLIRSGLNNKMIKADLFQPGIDEAPFINHWQRGMYQSLMQAFP